MAFSAEATALNTRIAADDALLATAIPALATARATMAAAVATWAHLEAGVRQVRLTSRGTPISSEGMEPGKAYFPAVGSDQDRADAWAAVEAAEAVVATALVAMNGPLFDKEVAEIRLGQLSTEDRNGQPWP